MNLFELNVRMSVKLNQPLSEIYKLEYMEYSLMLNIINNDIDKQNKQLIDISDIKNDSNNNQLSVGLPSHLKI